MAPTTSGDLKILDYRETRIFSAYRYTDDKGTRIKLLCPEGPPSDDVLRDGDNMRWLHLRRDRASWPEFESFVASISEFDYENFRTSVMKPLRDIFDGPSGKDIVVAPETVRLFRSVDDFGVDEPERDIIFVSKQYFATTTASSASKMSRAGDASSAPGLMQTFYPLEDAEHRDRNQCFSHFGVQNKATLLVPRVWMLLSHDVLLTYGPCSVDDLQASTIASAIVHESGEYPAVARVVYRGQTTKYIPVEPLPSFFELQHLIRKYLELSQDTQIELYDKYDIPIRSDSWLDAAKAHTKTVLDISVRTFERTYSKYPRHHSSQDSRSKSHRDDAPHVHIKYTRTSERSEQLRGSLYDRNRRDKPRLLKSGTSPYEAVPETRRIDYSSSSKASDLIYQFPDWLTSVVESKVPAFVADTRPADRPAVWQQALVKASSTVSRPDIEADSKSAVVRFSDDRRSRREKDMDYLSGQPSKPLLIAATEWPADLNDLLEEPTVIHRIEYDRTSMPTSASGPSKKRNPTTESEEASVAASAEILDPKIRTGHLLEWRDDKEIQTFAESTQQLAETFDSDQGGRTLEAGPSDSGRPESSKPFAGARLLARLTKDVSSGRSGQAVSIDAPAGDDLEQIDSDEPFRDIAPSIASGTALTRPVNKDGDSVDEGSNHGREQIKSEAIDAQGGAEDSGSERHFPGGAVPKLRHSDDMKSSVTLSSRQESESEARILREGGLSPRLESIGSRKERFNDPAATAENEDEKSQIEHNEGSGDGDKVEQHLGEGKSEIYTNRSLDDSLSRRISDLRVENNSPLHSSLSYSDLRSRAPRRHESHESFISRCRSSGSDAHDEISVRATAGGRSSSRGTSPDADSRALTQWHERYDPIDSEMAPFDSMERSQFHHRGRSRSPHRDLRIIHRDLVGRPVGDFTMNSLQSSFPSPAPPPRHWSVPEHSSSSTRDRLNNRSKNQERRWTRFRDDRKEQPTRDGAPRPAGPRQRQAAETDTSRSPRVTVPPFFAWLASSHKDTLKLTESEAFEVLLVDVDHRLREQRAPSTRRLYRSALEIDVVNLLKKHPGLLDKTSDDKLMLTFKDECARQRAYLDSGTTRNQFDPGSLTQLLYEAVATTVDKFLPATYPGLSLPKVWGCVDTVTISMYRPDSDSLEGNEDPGGYMIRPLEQCQAISTKLSIEMPDLRQDCRCLNTPFPTRVSGVDHLRNIHYRHTPEVPSEGDLDQLITSLYEYMSSWRRICLLHEIVDLWGFANEFRSIAEEIAEGVSSTNGHRYGSLTLAQSTVSAFELLVLAFVAFARIPAIIDKGFRGSGDRWPQASADLNDNLARHRNIVHKMFRDATEALALAKQETITTYLSSSTMANAITLTPVQLPFIVAVVLNNLQTRVFNQDVDVSTLYTRCADRLRYQVNQYPRKRLLQDIHHFEEEIDAVAKILCNSIFEVRCFASVTGLDPKFPRSVTFGGGIAEDGQYLRDICWVLDGQRAKLEQLRSRTGGLAAQVKRSVEILEEDHGKAIWVFTTVTTIFLPLSFVSSYLGMNTADVRGMNSTQGLFWAVAVPSTAFIISLALFLAYKGDTVVRTYDNALSWLRRQDTPPGILVQRQWEALPVWRQLRKRKGNRTNTFDTLEMMEEN